MGSWVHFTQKVLEERLQTHEKVYCFSIQEDSLYKLYYGHFTMSWSLKQYIQCLTSLMWFQLFETEGYCDMRGFLVSVSHKLNQRLIWSLIVSVCSKVITALSLYTQDSDMFPHEARVEVDLLCIITQKQCTTGECLFSCVSQNGDSYTGSNICSLRKWQFCVFLNNHTGGPTPQLCGLMSLELLTNLESKDKCPWNHFYLVHTYTRIWHAH